MIGALLDAPPAQRRRLLAAHHAALEAQVWRLHRRAHGIRHLIDDKEVTMSTQSLSMLDPDDERRLAAALFNRVWELLERTDRSRGEDDEMAHAAHASRYHWGRVGQPVNWARGEWQCSRVYAVLGRAEPALYHARGCLELAEAHGLGAFDVGCGHEALARAYRTAGDREAMLRHVKEAKLAAEQIDDAEDREVLLADLAQLEPSP